MVALAQPWGGLFRMEAILKVNGVEENRLAPCVEHEIWKPG